MATTDFMVSIIIPAYNCAPYLGETLDSVLRQTYTDWECIIVDDGSTDNTFAVADSYCSKHPNIACYRQENSGPSAARNNAIAHSSGEFLLPLDGDDIISDTYLEKAIRHFREHPETKLVYCQADTFGNVSETWELPPYSFAELLFTNCIFCTALFRREDFDKTPGFDTKMKEGLEDWDFWISLLGPDDIVYQIPETLFHYRIHGVSRTTRAAENSKKLWKQVSANHIDKYRDNIADVLDVFRHKMNASDEYITHLETELAQLRSSRAYKIGKAITSPFTHLRQIKS